MLKFCCRHLYTLFSKNKSAHPTPLANPNTRLSWNAQELNILLHNENQSHLVQVELPSRSGPFQTWLLGFDLTEHQLLIDSVFPAPPIELLAQLSHFKITLFKHQEVLSLQVRLVEKLETAQKPAWVVEVLTKHYQEDRRSHRRYTFERRHAPIAKIQIPLQPQWRASLVNVSKGGCLLNIFGKIDTQAADFKHPIRCHIQLNATHALDCLIKIKACDYFRSPCQHMQLRGRFVGLTQQQQACLQQFINQLDVPASSHAVLGLT